MTGFNARPFCETCDNFLQQDEYDEGQPICPNCSTVLTWPNGKTLTNADFTVFDNVSSWTSSHPRRVTYRCRHCGWTMQLGGLHPDIASFHPHCKIELKEKEMNDDDQNVTQGGTLRSMMVVMFFVMLTILVIASQ